jgi:hypothetical protein
LAGGMLTRLFIHNICINSSHIVKIQSLYMFLLWIYKAAGP